MPNHPLRRVSTGSLSSLARSQDRNNSTASGLDFLAGALTDFADEAATLSTNMQRLGDLHDALDQFNEGFAAYLYALKMNAFCIEWPEAPDPNSWARLPELIAVAPPPEPNVEANQSRRPVQDEPSSPTPVNVADMTYATVYSAPDYDEPPKRSVPARRPPPKRNLAAKKKHDLQISQIIDTQLPLEYRGGDIDSRLHMEQVIGKLMDSDEGCAIAQITGPTLPHPRANKCLIALVAKKLVQKSTAQGKTIYRWVGQ